MKSTWINMKSWTYFVNRPFAGNKAKTLYSVIKVLYMTMAIMSSLFNRPKSNLWRKYWTRWKWTMQAQTFSNIVIRRLSKLALLLYFFIVKTREVPVWDVFKVCLQTGTSSIFLYSKNKRSASLECIQSPRRLSPNWHFCYISL